MPEPPETTPGDAARLLSEYFDEESESTLPGALTLQQVRDFLKERIGNLLDTNPQRLMSILYRIDVAESAVQQAFETAPPGLLAQELAELVLERELQKLETRRRYREGGPSADSI
jgi:hypothetical protein